MTLQLQQFCGEFGVLQNAGVLQGVIQGSEEMRTAPSHVWLVQVLTGVKLSELLKNPSWRPAQAVTIVLLYWPSTQIHSFLPLTIA